MKTFSSITIGHNIYCLKWNFQGVPQIIVYEVSSIERNFDQYGHMLTSFWVKAITHNTTIKEGTSLITITARELDKDTCGWYFTEPTTAFNLLYSHVKLLTNAHKTYRVKNFGIKPKRIEELANIITNTRKGIKTIYEEVKRYNTR